MKLHVTLGIRDLFKPFRKHVPSAKFIRVTRRSVGYEQWEADCELLDAAENPIVVAETEELRQLSSLWGEQCFSDWVHNTLGDVLFQNMQSNVEVEPL
jgi:hypothetical protein